MGCRSPPGKWNLGVFGEWGGVEATSRVDGVPSDAERSSGTREPTIPAEADPAGGHAAHTVINIADYVTVYDWIVALCTSISQQDAVPALRLFVLDLAPRASSSAFGSRVLHSFLPRLPWIRVYRPVARHEEAVRSLCALSQSTSGHDKRAELLSRINGPNSLGIEFRRRPGDIQRGPCGLSY